MWQLGLAFIGLGVIVYAFPLILAVPKFLRRAFLARWFLSSYGVGYGKKIKISSPYGEVAYVCLMIGAVILTLYSLFAEIAETVSQLQLEGRFFR